MKRCTTFYSHDSLIASSMIHTCTCKGSEKLMDLDGWGVKSSAATTWRNKGNPQVTREETSVARGNNSTRVVQPNPCYY